MVYRCIMVVSLTQRVAIGNESLRVSLIDCTVALARGEKHSKVVSAISRLRSVLYFSSPLKWFP